jgi:acyl-CoA thioesterase I
MPEANKQHYLIPLVEALSRSYPDNQTIHIVCHGHSVPTGYFQTPFVNTFYAYPHLLHRRLKERFPFAVINVITSGKGGEDSEAGAMRFKDDVLCHKPNLLTIDYGLNDRRIGLARSKQAWEMMIRQATEQHIPILLMTPTLEIHDWGMPGTEAESNLFHHAHQIRMLSQTYGVGLVDAFDWYQSHVETHQTLSDVLSQSNHPNSTGHRAIADLLLQWFPIVD